MRFRRKQAQRHHWARTSGAPYGVCLVSPMARGGTTNDKAPHVLTSPSIDIIATFIQVVVHHKLPNVPDSAM
jgi:hypothetical protein